MRYTKQFRGSSFEWTGSAKKIYEMISSADKYDDFEDLLKEHFGTLVPEDWEISRYVADQAVSIMNSLGLDINGKPLSPKKKYNVFFRITATVSEEAEAESHEEAARIAHESLMSVEGGDPFAMVYRDDILESVPVCYDDGDFNTKDYPEGFKVDPE